MNSNPRLRRLGSALALVSLLAPVALPAQTSQSSSSTGIDLKGMDRSVKPGDDFFSYANGTWLKKTEIPADKSGYGAGAILADLTDSGWPA